MQFIIWLLVKFSFICHFHKTLQNCKTFSNVAKSWLCEDAQVSGPVSTRYSNYQQDSQCLDNSKTIPLQFACGQLKRIFFIVYLKWTTRLLYNVVIRRNLRHFYLERDQITRIIDKRICSLWTGRKKVFWASANRQLSSIYWHPRIVRTIFWCFIRFNKFFCNFFDTFFLKIINCSISFYQKISQKESKSSTRCRSEKDPRNEKSYLDGSMGNHLIPFNVLYKS